MSQDPRNLLFGLYAVRVGLLAPESLLAETEGPDRDGSEPLGITLVDRGAMSAEDRELVETLVDRHLQRNGGDPTRGLEALGVAPERDLSTLFEPGHSEQPTEDFASAAPTIPASGSSGGQGGAQGFAPGSRYQVLHRHDGGGLGQVFVAIDRELGREVALKQIKGSLVDNPVVRERFVLEAEISGNLEHPNIVPVYGMGRHTAGDPFYAMRFIRGENLKAAIAAYHKDIPSLPPGERSLRLRGLLGRFVAICDAIAFAHARGVLHRDLKPSNIMVGRYGETILIDWGLAKVTGRLDPAAGLGVDGALNPPSGGSHDATLVGSAVGTPQFMSPEQAAGRLEEIGTPADIYGLGAILYAILTGRPPVEGWNLKETLDKARAGEIRPPCDLVPQAPKGLAAICMKALSTRPSDRYGMARELAVEVERWLADEPVAAYPEPWAARAARLVRHHRTAAAVAASLIVASLLGLIVVDLNVRREKARVELARAEADESLGVARGSVRIILTDLASLDLPAVPQSEAFRLRVAIAAGRLNEGFLRRRPADRGVRSDAAAIDREVGNIHRLLNNLDAAEAPYRRSIAISDGLAREFPSDGRSADTLALTLVDLAELHQLRGLPREAEVVLRQALQVIDTIPRSAALRVDPARTTAVALTRLAGLQLEQGRLTEAMAASGRASAIFVGMERARGLNLMDRLIFAMAEQVQGTARIESGEDIERGTEALERSLTRCDLDAIRALPARSLGSYSIAAMMPSFRYVRAYTLLGLGRAFSRSQGSSPNVERTLSEAIDEFDGLGDAFPRVVAYARGRAAGRTRRGAARLVAGEVEGARADHSKAVEILKGMADSFPKSGSICLDYGLALADLGLMEAWEGRPREAALLLRKAESQLDSSPIESPAAGAALRKVRDALKLAKPGRTAPEPQ